MANAALENGLATLAFARRNTLGFFEDIPSDKLCYQPVVGANHALWILGHLCCTDNFFLTALGDRPRGVPDEWDKLFGMGSAPTSVTSAYPSIDTIKEKLTERRSAVIEWFKSMSEERLASPLPKDFSTFAPNHAAMASSLAWHEGLHAGQLTMIRRSLGIKPKMG